jgi:hypothetical protein
LSSLKKNGRSSVFYGKRKEIKSLRVHGRKRKRTPDPNGSLGDIRVLLRIFTRIETEI